MFWIVGIIVAFVLLVLFVLNFNKKACMKAYGQGITDAHEVAWQEIPDRYSLYLSPMRPMDAAAYKRGLEYAILCSNIGDWKEIKKDFLEGYKSGEITSDGTIIRRMAENGIKEKFELRLKDSLTELFNASPLQPPVQTKVFSENGKSGTAQKDM